MGLLRRAEQAQQALAGLNQGFRYSGGVGRWAGHTLLDYLSLRFKHTDVEGWRAHLEQGRVTVDDALVPGHTVLREGQIVTYARAPWEEPKVPTDIEVLFDRGGVVVVNKPAGLPTQAGGGFLENTLVHLLEGAAPVHRLGRWTSGLVVCARDTATGADLTRQFTSRSVYKRYRTLALGRATQPAFTVRQPIGPVPYAPLGTLHAASPQGRPACTRVTVLEQREGDFLADVVIESGRPHQIRIHMAFAGHPLVGDPLYRVGGLPDPLGTALPGDAGYCLHAARVRFVHPDGGEVVVDSPIPEGLRACRTPESESRSGTRRRRP